MKNLTQLIQENKKLKNQILEYKQVLGGHPYMDDSLIKGGLHVVNTLEERNKIGCCHRKQGMRVIVVGEDQSFRQYELLSKTCMNNWREIVSDVDETIVKLVSDYSELGEDLNNQQHLNQVLKSIVLDLQQQISNIPEVPSNLSEFNNDVGFITEEDLPPPVDISGKADKATTYTKTEVNNALGLKLDKPTVTASNTITYTHAVLVDSNNNPAKYPAGDLGKNVANSALTSVTGAKLTLGADWDINVGTGFYFGLKGLLDKSADATWNRLLMTDSSGRVAYTNGKNLLKGIPALLTEAEKTAWKVEMNGGWTTNTMSVATISPPVLKRFDEPIYVVLRGANLNLNPANFSIQIISSDGSTVIDTIPNSQIQLNTVGTTLTFWCNYKDIVEGNYKLRLWNGVASYDTPTNLSIVTNTTDIDLSSVTWDFLTNPTWGSTNNSTGGVFNISTPATTSDTAEIIASAKSSKLFNIGENFVLEIQATFTQAGANAENNSYSYLGVGYDITPNVLTKVSIVSVESSRRNNATIKITNNQSNVQVTTMPATANITFIKQYNLITTIVEGVSTSLVNTTISSNSDYSLFIQLSRRIGTQSISGAILKAYKF